jgi:MYXO-CTERM domain-containing protein
MANRRLTSLRSALALAAALAAAGAAAPDARAEDWGTPGLDGAHARLTPERSGALFADGRWTTSFPGGARVLASPAVADGFLVSVDLAGAVHALAADTGASVWQTAAGSAVQGSPAIVNGRVFVPTVGNKLVALGLADGAPLWTRDLGGMILSSPTPIGGDLVLAAGFPERRIVRVTAATGEIVWQSPAVMNEFSNTSPAVGGGLVVVGSNGGHYYAFDAATGALRWDYAADGVVHLAAPLIAGGRVYLAGGNDSDRVHAIDAATGAPVAGWPVTLPVPDPDVAGTRVGRQRAVSSLAAVGGLVVLQTRLDDALDQNADGAADETLSREVVFGLDPASGAVVWQVPLARAEIADPNDVPKFFVCPTPAAFGTDAGAPLLAAASSLDPAVVVLDAASGGERARHIVAGPALASPVVANGRLFTAPMNGSLQGLGSSVNHAPGAPVLAAAPRPLDAADVTLRWLPSTDADGELPSYELRIDADGELLQSWQQQIFLAPGTTSTHLTASLQPGVTYTFALRARDGHGALSPWSAAETFSVVQNPTVTVGGTPVGSLAGALAAAQPGDVIMLGAGTYKLTDTLHVPGGVSMQGAGAGRTILDATGLPVGVSFDGTAAGHDSVLDGLTVAGADTCVEVSGAATGVRVSHAIVRDCRTDGVAVRTGGAATVVNATFAGDGAGVHATGTATVKNSLLAGNGAAMVADSGGKIGSSYDDVFDNQTDYRGLAAGTGDLAASVAFGDFAGRDLRLVVAQPSTDKGDPADAVGDEPAPNGGRINLGAFGGTADAETSAPSTAIGGGGLGHTPGADPTPPGQTTPPAGDGGCAVGGRSDHSSHHSWVVLLVAAALFARRRRAFK